MICLTQSEIDQWFSDQLVTPAPYDKTETPTYYIQFSQPTRPLVTASFVRQFLSLTDDRVLIHITDWPTYEPAEMIVVDALRNDANEARNLIDAAGHLVASENAELAIALFGHTCNFAWNAYMYSPNDRATLYNWEGELFDFWSNSETLFQRVVQLVNNFGLATTNSK